MTIDRDELINLLVEKTDMDRSSIEKQLDELTKRILDAAKRGKALEIKGFGLFYFDETGDMTFRVSDQLDSEINFSHAGMEPVEIEPPKQGAASSSTNLPLKKEDTKETLPAKKLEADKPKKTGETADADDIFGIGKTLSGETDSDKEDRDGPADSEPFGKLFQEGSDVEPEPKPKEKVKKAGTAAKKSSTSPSPKKKAAVKKRDPMNVIIMVVLGGVFLFAAYFVFTEFLEPPEQGEPETAQQQDIEVEDPPVTAERDVTEATEPEEPEAEQVPEPQNDPEPLDDPIDEVTTTDPYGLYGDLADTEGTVYTIVVHSLGSQSVANRTADELRADGFRISIRETNVDGETYYRVGIGQFPTIREAQQEASTLPEPYNNQNFIQRLQ